MSVSFKHIKWHENKKLGYFYVWKKFLTKCFVKLHMHKVILYVHRLKTLHVKHTRYIQTNYTAGDISYSLHILSSYWVTRIQHVTEITLCTAQYCKSFNILNIAVSFYMKTICCFSFNVLFSVQPLNEIWLAIKF